MDRCIADCRRVGLLRDDDQVIVRNQVDMPYAYVVHDHGRPQRVAGARLALRNTTSSSPAATASGSTNS